MAAPIQNPIIPCVYPLPGGFQPGTMIRIQGNTMPGAQRFAINLQCGPNTDPRDDIAFHFNVHFREGCIVRNNLMSSNWGPEETGGMMPLGPGQPFTILLLCEQSGIKAAVNGNHFCEFMHRTPPQRISYITIDGDVQVQIISFEGGAPQGQGYGAPPAPYGAAPGYGPPPAYGQPPGYAPPAYGDGSYGYY